MKWWTQYKERRATKARAKKREQEGCKVYEFKSQWGDSLTWCDMRSGKVQGFKHRIPRVGDLAVSDMQSGRKLVVEFIDVRPCGDPVDMFFATVEMIAYTDEPAGKAALTTATKDTGGMHPAAHRFWEPAPYAD